MSLDEVQRNVPIKPQQLFFHSELLKPEIELFKDQFERNERFKEFDGLIKANHRIYEALETKIAVDKKSKNKLFILTEQMKSIADRIVNMSSPQFSKEEIVGYDFSKTIDFAKYAELKQKELERKRIENENGPIFTIIEEEKEIQEL
ncbi:hypothetical protein ACQ4LE_002461 [Meloidogyne hapla]|uniref:ING domain-containing protein n=1 Tax=Meloidogyne hapla TaxID=6305 RepID=A0A1I8BW36_MELHA